MFTIEWDAWTNTRCENSTQYHAALILLHRALIQYGQDEDDDSIPERDESFKHLTTLSRSVCTESAKRIALIFEQYRTRFNIAQVFETGLQHAGTAATALMGEIAILERERHGAVVETKEALVSRLESLRLTLSLMSRNYQPAILMTRIVDQFIRQIEPRPKETKKRSLQTDTPEGETSRRLDRRKRPRLATQSAYPQDRRSRNSRVLPPLPSDFLGALRAEDEEMQEFNEHPEYWVLFNSHLELNM